jgi:hypothetical protein
MGFVTGGNGVWWSGSSPFRPRMRSSLPSTTAGQMRESLPRHQRARVLHLAYAQKVKGRREGRVFCAPIAARAWVESTRVSHYRFAETFRPSLRNGFNGLSSCSPRCTGLDSHRRSPMISELDPSVGRSGPHDLTVREWRRSSNVHSRPPHPASYVRDDRDTPSFRWRDVRTIHPI